MASRYCIIDKNGGNVIVKLNVKDALSAGSDFKLLSNPKIDWKMKAGDNGNDSEEIKVKPSSLNNIGLTWEILVCSFEEDTTKGIVEIQIFQDNVSRPVTKPMQWPLTNIPLCSTGNTKSIKGGLYFMSSPTD